ncbi:PD-(D/E)XK nuclease family protein [Caldinitratiruptor microaerophilus]|uniref:PD-(D/E)XK nuclease superfamily protein n=1 Tax=Caldinitratiruptor microaerophilus TaxID=671077 RepID=A0AA35G9W2_9FIRM|nr:hypothetical protein [Caldinitratiruptor microaerophilus]BDG61893.1 hypothetical protein caldi_29830 [Caldinitratiruptor microaerophilus]
MPPSTSELVLSRIRARHEDSGFDPSEIRLSEAGGCPRKQTLRILGYPAEEVTDRQLGIFEAGDYWEDYLFHTWSELYPRRVRRQVPVRTPYGVGHIDLWVAPERHIVECKTTQAKSRDYLPMDQHLAQVQMYLHFWGRHRSATAEVAYVIKETAEVVSFPVQYNRYWAEELEEGLRRIAQHVTEGRPAPVPEGYSPDSFPCGWGDGRCPYWSHCWGDDDIRVAPPTPEELAPVLEPLFAQYAAAKARLKAAEDQAEAIKSEVKSLEARMDELFQRAGVNVLRAGAWEVQRTPVAGRPKLDLDAAIKAGVIDPQAVAPYMGTTASYTRWTIRQPKEKAKEAKR